MVFSSSGVIPIPVSVVKYEDKVIWTCPKVRTGDDETSGTLLIPDCFDGNVHLLGTAEDYGFREGSETKLFEGIVGIGDEFTKEDISANLSNSGMAGTWI